MVETVFQNCFVITYQNKLTLLTPFIQFLAILEKMKLVKFFSGNFSTPEGHDSHRTIGFFLPSKCLSNPVSHRFLEHVENKNIPMNETYQMSVISKTHSFGEMAILKKSSLYMQSVSKEIQSFVFIFFINPILLKYHSTKLEVKD